MQSIFFYRLKEVICKMGNPFLDQFPELITLDSRNVVDSSVAANVRKLESLGKEQYGSYNQNVIMDQTEAIQKSIKKNNLALFSTPLKKIKSKDGSKVQTLRINAELMGKMLIALQSRNGDLQEFFSHEVQSFPPSLSDGGEIHLPSNKSQILSEIVLEEEVSPPPKFDSIS